MELDDLKKIVEETIKDFETKVQTNPISVLSEGDFERILSSMIEMRLEGTKFAVHNQVSHYLDFNDPLDYRVDVVIMNNDDIKECQEKHKGYIYQGDSVAIELKYFRPDDDAKKIADDFNKSDSLLNKDATPNTYFFIVALLEKSDEGKVTQIKKIANQYKNKDNLIFKTISKQKGK